MNPVRNASRIIVEASSNRSRNSSRVPRKAANSRRARPRPSPSLTRPLLSRSSTDTFSATRSGSFHGRMIAAVPRSACVHSGARYDSSCVLSGQNE